MLHSLYILPLKFCEEYFTRQRYDLWVTVFCDSILTTFDVDFVILFSIRHCGYQ